MGMAKKVAEDIADMLLNEHVNITIADEATDEFVKKVLSSNNWQQMGNNYQEKKRHMEQLHMFHIYRMPLPTRRQVR